jgi:hypothetical protein
VFFQLFGAVEVFSEFLADELLEFVILLICIVSAEDHG